MATTTKYLPSEMAAAIDAIPIFSNITAEDNGMVVVNGHLQDQTSRTIVANGTYDTTANDEVQVNVSPSGNVTLADKAVTENGTYLPSGDSVDGYSKVTVNVPTVSEADNGKAVSGGRLVEQTTKSISANGTYNTTLNNSVIVNVPNSGSGSSVVTYDVPDFIENSDKSKVLLDLYADDYDETNQSWGDMVLMTNTDSFFKDYYGVLKLDSQGLEVGGRYGYRFNLQNTSKVTIYAIAKRRQFISHSGEALVNADYFVADIASSHTSSYPLYAAALSYNGPFVESPIGKFNVYTLTVDIENLSASLYANGAFISSKQLDSTDRLRHIRFGEDADVQYLYVGAVAGIEDTQTIFANHHVAMTFIQDARMILPDDDMPSPMFLSNSEPDDILVNADYRDFSSSDNTFGPFTSHGGVLTDDCEGVLVSGGVALTYALPTSVNGLTVYAVIKKVFDWDKVSGAYTEANSILFQIGNTSGDSGGVYLHGRTGRTGTYPETSYQVFDLSPVEEFGVYAISVNYRTRKANFYFEGSLKATVDISDIPYDVFTIGGRYVSGELSAESQVQLLFAGVVSGVEDSTVIAQNSIELREFMNDSRIALGTEVKSVISKTITKNGTYNPASDGAYAYSQVIVDVQQHTEMPSGGVIPTFLESSNQNNIVESIDYTDFDSENGTWGDFTVATREDVVGELSEDCRGVVINKNISLVHTVPSANGGVTIYAIVSVRDSGPILDTKESQVEVIARKSEISLYTAESANESYGIDVPVGLFNVIAVSINYSTLAVEFYVNGVLVHTGRTLYVPTKIYFGGNVYSDTGYISTANPTDINCLYFGMVSGVESQNVIVNNMSVMQSFVAHSRIFLQDSTPSIPTFLSHSVQSSVLANSNYYDFLNGLDGFSLVSGNLSHSYFGTRIDENTAVSCDVSGISEGLTIYLIARAYNTGKTKVTFDSTHIMYGPAFVLSLVDASDDSSLFNVRIGDSAAIYYADGHDNTTTQNVYGTPFLTFNAYAITVSYDTGVVTLYMNEINPNPPTLTIGQVVSAGRLILGGEYEDVWSNEPSYSHTFKSDGQLLHCGVVDGVESSGTIGQNLADMVSFLQNARFKVPTEVSLVAKTITANGTYDPEDDNADGYSQVTVNVPASATQDGYVPEFLEYSNANNILMNIDYTDFDSETGEWGDVVVDVGELYQDAFGIVNDPVTGTHVTIPSEVNSVTLYFICRQWRDYWNGSVVCDVGAYHDNNAGAIMTVGLCFTEGENSVHAGILSSGVVGAYSETYDAGIPPTLFNAYAIKLDYTNKTVSFYCNDKYIGTVTVTNVNRDIYFGGEYRPTASNPTLGFTSLHFLHMGIVSGNEQPDTIFNNLGSMVSFINDSRVFLPESETLVPTFLQHSQPSSILLNANYADFSGRWGGFSTDAGRMSYDCFGVRVDEDTALSFDVSQTTAGITIYMIAKPYFYGKYKYYPDKENWPYAIVYGPSGIVAAKDTTNDTTPFYFSLASTARVYSGDGKTYGEYDRIYPVFSFCAYAITAAYDTGLVTFYMNDSEPVTLELGEAISVDSIAVGGVYDFWHSYMEDYVKGEHSDSQFLHFGIVNGVESSDTIAQNLSDMVSFLTNARFMIPPTPSDIP